MFNIVFHSKFKNIRVHYSIISNVSPWTVKDSNLKSLSVVSKLKKSMLANKNLKISDLASLLNTTDKALSHHIHENFGMSFTNYINQLRVEKVKTLLYSREQDKYTLLAIAEKAGFSSKSSFNAVFKKITGLTPTQYKTRYKN